MTESEIEELLGAYALDAVDPEEAAEIERHLEVCPRCRAEVAAHREVATMLGNAGGVAPDAVWARIAGELSLESEPSPPAPEIDLATITGLAPGAARRARRRGVAVAASLGSLAAALLVVVGLLSAHVADLNTQVHQLNGAIESNGVAALAAAAESDPAHRTVTLDSTATGNGAGRVVAELVVLPDGRAFLHNRSMPSLAANSTYQLWTISAGRLVSLGIVGSSPRWVAVVVDPSAKVFMVTAEPAGGVTTPTHPVLARGGYA